MMREIIEPMINKLLGMYEDVLHPSRFDCLKSIMAGIVTTGSVQISKIARTFSGPAQLESVCSRIRRFLEDEEFDSVEVARNIAKILGLTRISRWTLVVDRTNWKLGDTHNNLLVLGVIHKKSFIPLIFNNLGDTRKSGNSSTADRQCIMDTFREAFPDQKIKSLIGDREFIGWRWVAYLNKEKIPYILRIKENWDVIFDEDNKRTIPIKDYISSTVNDKRVQRIDNLSLGSEGKITTSLTVFPTKTRDGERNTGIVMHSPGIKNAHLEYRKRWSIEVAFKHMKTGGLNLEDSHIKNRDRFKTLMHIIFMTIAWIFKFERFKHAIKLKPNRINGLSVFRVGFEKLIRFIMCQKKQTLKGPY